MKPIYLDDDATAFRVCPDCKTQTGEHDAGCPTALADELQQWDAQRHEFAHASKVAMQRIEEEARLKEAAKKDVVAAQEVLRRTFRRYQQAMQDGTEGEQKGWREELRTACAQYNVLAGRLTTEAA